MQLQSEQIVARTPEEVFDLLADACNEVRWNHWARQVDKISKGPVGPGTRFRARIQNMGQVEFELAEYQRPSRLQQQRHMRQMERGLKEYLETRR